MRCPVCGSDRLAWSDELGYLVCQDCGAIISELIDDDAAPAVSPVQAHRKKSAGLPSPVTAPLEEAVEEASKRAVARGRVLIVVGRSVRLAPPIRRDLGDIGDLLEIMRGFPDLRSRTRRVRAAIAVYAALRAAGLSRSRAAEVASRAAGVSPRSVAKVWETHRRSMEGYERAVALSLSRTGQDRLMRLLSGITGQQAGGKG